MVCYHANATVQFPNLIVSDSIFDQIMAGINHLFTGQAGTYFFMMLSAFLLYRNITPDNARKKVRSRVYTLLIPWLLWNLIGLISYHPFDKSLQSIICDYLMSRFCEQLWFVQALVIFLIFIPLFMRVLRMKGVREIVVILIYILNYLMHKGILSMQFLAVLGSERFCLEISRMLEHLPVYCLGAYLGLNRADYVMEETYNQKQRKAVVTIAVALIVLSYVYSAGYLQTICFMLRPAALWVICRKALFAFEPKWWMQIPFYTYAIHNFILHFVGKGAQLSGFWEEQYRAQTISVGAALLWRVCMTGIAFALAAVSAAILMRFAPKAYELLTGGRNPRK